jgi:mRNA interferase MazF
MTYIPDRGDIIWLEFNPQAGPEQAGHKPAFVLSPKAYNAQSGLSLVCPITSKVKGYVFEVPIPSGLPVNGVVLTDQIRSIDWRVCQAEFISTASPNMIQEVLAKTRTLID